LLPAILTAQPGKDVDVRQFLNDKSTFDLADYFNNYLGATYKSEDFVSLSESVRVLDSLNHFVGVTSGYAILSLEETRTAALRNISSSDSDYFLSGFTFKRDGGIGIDFYVNVRSQNFTDQQNSSYSRYIEYEVNRYSDA
jgi:hypothetical protein